MAPNQIGDVITNITDDVKTIVRGEIDLLKAELVPTGKNVGVGAGMFGAAGYLGLNAVSLLFMAGGFAFGLLFTELLGWPLLAGAALGFVCMTLVLLLIAGILALIGKSRIEQAKGPEKTVTEAEATVAAVKGAVERGKDQVTSGAALARHESERDEARLRAVTARVEQAD